jgi:hypothetical protein
MLYNLILFILSETVYFELESWRVVIAKIAEHLQVWSDLLAGETHFGGKPYSLSY